EERNRYLAEPTPIARAGYQACELLHGRPARPEPSAPAPAKPKGPRSAVLEADTDLFGMDYRGFYLDKASPELCQRACLTDARCRAFTYVKPGLHGLQARCYLKEGRPKRRWTQCCVSGIVQ